MKYKLLKKTGDLDQGNIVDDECFPFVGGAIIFQLLLDLGYIEEYDPSKKWEPKDGEEYYYIDGEGEVRFTKYSLIFSYDRVHKEIGNCFQTREEAEAMAEKFKVLLKGNK